MKAIMLSPVFLNVCNVRLFLNGLRRGRGPLFAIAALASVLMTGTLRADTHYVNATRPNDSGNGLSWATAEKTIQAAINAAAAGDKIVVTNGVYAPISTENKAITIQSFNGEAVTIIDGGNTARCATLGSSSSHTNTVLVGFTLQNGYASSSSGGGSYYGTLNNCTLSGNSASSSGGGSYYGTLNNCTLTGNSASSSGGGSYYGTLNNCIAWGNMLFSGVTNNYSNGTFSYSCTAPLPSGTGNLSADPLFRLPALGDFRLSPGSPCLNAGTNGYAIGSMDGFGNPRIQDGTVDMGAYEGAGTLLTDGTHLARNVLAIGGTNGITVSWDAPSSGGAVLYRVFRMDISTDQWTPVSGWITELTFLETQVFGGVTYRYVVVSSFDTRLDAISGLSASEEGQRTLIPQFYVDASRPDDAGDGRSWLTAKKNIQTAIGISIPYDTILVTNGVYGPISTANKAITIQSVNGAAVTIIDGGGINRCATLGSASVHLKSILVGFTLRNGSAVSYGGGGGSSYGTLNNCTLSGNRAIYGGGSYYGLLNNCTLTGNSASSNGGGSYEGTLNNCTLSGNSAFDGGGSYYGALNNCTLSGNSAYSGGGSYYGALNNCTLSGNSASSSGGGSSYGTLNNCTLSGNSASFSGGGSYYCTLNNCTLSGNSATSGGGSYFGTLNNCIVWGNTLVLGETNNYYGGTFSYSCTTPLPSGTGNLSVDPLFRLPAAGDFRLSPGSPCLNAGTNACVVGVVDVIGNTRIQDGTVDMGAYEGAGTLVTDGTHLARIALATGDTNSIVVSWNPPSAGGAVLYRVCRLDMTTGQWIPVSGWITELSFLDTRVFFGVTYRYAIVSAFDARPDVISGLSEPAEGQRMLPQLYVDASRPSDAGDGRSWATAKRTIQGAIGASNPYDTILVTNGVYAQITTTNNVIMIRSVNGAAVTVIDGGGTSRCATLGSESFHLNSILTGFTLRNGYASFGAGASYGTLDNCILSGNSSSYGGGSYYGRLNNCTLSGNSASGEGGGSYYGTLKNCTLSGNSASYGGGSYEGTLNNCTLTGNSASNVGGGSKDGTLNNCTLTGNTASSGGGAYGGRLNNCTLTRNSASSSGGGSTDGTLSNCTLTGNTASYGGGAYGGTLNNCTLTGNSASSSGGGSYYGTLNNCLLTDNRTSTSGGGSFNGTLNNCTLTGNSASTSGGGSYYGTLNNCIAWGNMLFSGVTNNYSSGTFRYTCTTPLPPGTGNLSADPLFRLPTAGDFRLSPGSPCLNAGTNGYAIGSMDGFGNPRIQDGTVDMGAYEGAWTLLMDTPHLARNVSAMEDTDGIAVSWEPPSAGGAVLYRVLRLDMATGQWMPVSDWIAELSFLDTRAFSGVIYHYSILSAFDTQLDILSGLSASAEGQSMLQLYVDASRPSDAGDGRSWATAKHSIQAAISIATPYDTILVTNGVYAPITTTNNVIAIRSVNGADVTVIDGGGTNRCATLGSAADHASTILVGFTLRNGYASYGGGSYYGTLINCTLAGNSASTDGGGSYCGALNNCILTGNSAPYGGGSCYGTLNNCTLSGNSGTWGGGSWYGTLNNCTLSGNSAAYGGGSSWSLLNNCTLTGNCASSSGGGSSKGTLSNCIVWGNTLVSGETNNYYGGTFLYSCTVPLPSGTGNLSADPLFRLPAVGDYSLSPRSPCINTGSNPFVVGATDLAGNPRIVAGTVDMGAYEMPPRVTVTFDASGGLLATGQTSTNFAGYTGDLYASWLTLSNGISRTGYSFAGWWTEPAGAGTQVTGDTTITLTTDHTLYAAWTANTYTLTLDAAGGTVSPASRSVTFDAAYGDLPVPTRPGYTFSGWWRGDSGTGTQVTGDTTMSLTADHTLSAAWTVNTYTLTLDAGGGTVSPGSKRVTFDAAYGDLPAPARGGYRFEGWWTGVGGTGTQVTSATPVSIAGDHTLYVKWAEDPYLCTPEATDPLSSAGTYEGFFHSESDFDGTPVSAVRGTLSLTLSALTGKLTAKAVMNRVSLRFSQSAWASPDPDDGVRRAVLTGLGGEVLDLYVGQDRIWGTLSGGSLDSEIFELAGARNRFSDRADPVAQALLNSFRGYYTVALPVYSALSLGAADAAPEGTGYLTFTVGDRGSVRIAGVLADGTKVSQSSHLTVFDSCGPKACVPLFVPLYGRKGWVGGLLWLDPVSRTIVTDRDLGWFIRWEQPGTGPDGFSVLLDACGGFYSTTESLAAHYRFSAQTNAVPYVHPRGIETIEPVFPYDIAVTVDGTRLTMTGGVKPLRTGDVYDYAASENSSMATLTFQPATGIFKGGFKLYADYTMINSLQHRVVSVLYSGVLAPVRATAFDGLPAGQGYYLVPDNTPAVAPYRLKRSYRIELDDAR